MVTVINKYFLEIFNYSKNNHLLHWSNLYIILDDFIIYKKIIKIQKDQTIFARYMGQNTKKFLELNYDFFNVYKIYKKSYFLFKLNEKSYK